MFSSTLQKEKDNSAKIAANEKRFIATVLKGVQRMGYPRDAVYTALRTYCQNRANNTTAGVATAEGVASVVDLCASPVKTKPTDESSDVTMTTSDSTTGEDTPTEVATDGSQYLLTWTQLAAECVSGVAPAQLQFIETGPDRVREIVGAIVQTYHQVEKYSSEATNTVTEGESCIVFVHTIILSEKVGSIWVWFCKYVCGLCHSACIHHFSC